MLPSASSGRTSFGSFVREPFQDRLRLIRAFERIEIEGFANIDGTLQRRSLRNLVVGRDRILIALRRFLGIGQRRESEGMVGLDVERKLQIDYAEADAAFTGQRLAQAIKDFGHSFRRRRDEKRRLFALVDAIQHVLGERMRIAFRLCELLAHDLPRQFEIAVVSGVLSVSKGRAQSPAVLTEHFLIRGCGDGLAARKVGDQRTMIAQIELRPVRLLGKIDGFQGSVGIASGKTSSSRARWRSSARRSDFQMRL